MAFWATELGLVQVGSWETIALFFNNQLLRYWILQSQWKGLPDMETFLRPTSLSNRPGDTEVSWLSCTWSSVVSEGRWGSFMRLRELQLTCRPAGRAAKVCALDAAKSRKTANPELKSILQDQEEITSYFHCKFQFAQYWENTLMKQFGCLRRCSQCSAQRSQYS